MKILNIKFQHNRKPLKVHMHLPHPLKPKQSSYFILIIYHSDIEIELKFGISLVEY